MLVHNACMSDQRLECWCRGNCATGTLWRA